jgi:phosphomannomutase
MNPQLIAQALDWIADDPDPTTRAELQALLDADDEAAVADRFTGFLEFGTAGLRGALGAGPNRMNRVVVGRTALGLIAFLKERGLQRVVVGYDARHNSERFALDTVELLRGAKMEAFLMPRVLPTPVLAYSVEALNANAGVMVTASHNPPQDNGYKVYLGGVVDGVNYRGSQIVPPADAQIATHIANVQALASAPRADGWQIVDEEIISAYCAAAVATIAKRPDRDIKIVHTALHGVGTETIRRVFQEAGFPEIISVAEQADPDPDFPTVAFPNPEEAGAIDLAIETAKRVGADLVIANDPDADRCAAAVEEPESGWRMLRGDEVGVLLGDYLAAAIDPKNEQTTLAASIVSSTMLKSIAAHYGLTFTATLTGFKWLAKVPNLAYGYEEALGYCVDPTSVNDKDGVSAALMLAALAAELRSQNKTLVDRLAELANLHGLYSTDQLSIRLSDLSVIPTILRRLIANPPSQLAGMPLESVIDLSLSDGALPPTDGVVLEFTQGLRVIIRPSGTEPKIKCYLQLITPVTGTISQSRSEAGAVLGQVKDSVRSLLGV